MAIDISDSELNIMKVLWKEGDLTAGQLSKNLNEQVGWNRNTTYTLIKRLIDKGVIERYGDNFSCRATITKEQVQKHEGAELIGKLFGGLERMTENINREEFVNFLISLAQAAQQIKPKQDSEYIEIFSMDISKTPAKRLKELSDGIEDFNIESVYNGEGEIEEEAWCFFCTQTRESNLLFVNNNPYSYLRAFPNEEYTQLSIRSASGKDSVEKVVKFFQKHFEEIEIL